MSMVNNKAVFALGCRQTHTTKKKGDGGNGGRRGGVTEGKGTAMEGKGKGGHAMRKRRECQESWSFVSLLLFIGVAKLVLVGWLAGVFGFF